MLPKSVLYYGSEKSPPERIELRAGPLSMIFEPETAFLRYLRLGDREVLRGIYVAVRDRNWGTVSPEVSQLNLETAEDAFHLSFEVRCRQREIDFAWKGVVAGDPTGTVSFTMDGTARSTFLRNRIGFCVLHPIRACAGQPCVVEKTDGTLEHGSFPYEISPHQLFLDMRAISYEALPDLSVQVRFAGDVFEMEDQRNWTDASYKTYCTPLSEPLPVKIEEGTELSQSITVTLEGDVSSKPIQVGQSSSEVVCTVEEGPSTPLPRIGLGVASHGGTLNERERERLKALYLDHLRVDLDLSDLGYGDVLERAALEADALGISLDVALFLTDAAERELDAVVEDVGRVNPRVSTWLVFHKAETSTTAPWVGLARRYLSVCDPEAKIGGGTNAYFTELNRDRPPAEALDLVCYSLNPQVHAFDNASLLETLEGQAETVKSARRFVGDLPLAVTPVTLRPRFNPDATGAEPELRPGELPPEVDVRQMSLLGAGWTLGSLKHLSEGGIRRATYYETTGWRGVMETKVGSRSPFRSIPGAVFPLYHVLADVGEFAGGCVVPSTSSAPLCVTGMVLCKEDRTRILLANLGPEPRHVRLIHSGLGACATVKHLNETNAERAMCSPESFRADPGDRAPISGEALELRLMPYSLARIDTEAGSQRQETGDRRQETGHLAWESFS